MIQRIGSPFGASRALVLQISDVTKKSMRVRQRHQQVGQGEDDAAEDLEPGLLARADRSAVKTSMRTCALRT